MKIVSLKSAGIKTYVKSIQINMLFIYLFTALSYCLIHTKKKKTMIDDDTLYIESENKKKTRAS